jgi:hypothetical protein
LFLGECSVITAPYELDGRHRDDRRDRSDADGAREGLPSSVSAKLLSNALTRMND